MFFRSYIWPFRFLISEYFFITLARNSFTILSGAHTFGKARCLGFAHRLFNFSGQGAPDPTLNKSFLKKLQKICPQGGNGSVITDLDVTTPNAFDNAYFTNLKIGKGLLETDQILLSAPGADTADIVKKFSKNTFAFFEAFVLSMIRMGNLSVLTGNQGEIRLNCRVVNGPSTLSDDNLVSSIWTSETLKSYLC